MSFAGPNPIRDGVRPSKVLSERDDENLRNLVFDCGFDFTTKDGMPQLLIGNGQTGCRAEYFPRRGRKPTKFVFYHGFEMFATTCGCLIRSAPETITYDVPEDLAEHAIRLVEEHGLETKHASIVVMKLFLGLDIPASLRGSFSRSSRPIDVVEPPLELETAGPSPSRTAPATEHTEEMEEKEVMRGQQETLGE